MSTPQVLSLYRTYAISFHTAITLLVEDNGMTPVEAKQALSVVRA